MSLVALASEKNVSEENCLNIALGVETLPTLGREISEALEHGGICNSVKFLPSKRVTHMLRSGELDGELKISAYGEFVNNQAIKID